MSANETPIPAYQFSVEIDREPLAIFQSVSGLSAQRAVEKIAEGGVNNYEHRFPGRLTYGNLTLEKGQSSSVYFWNWMMQTKVSDKGFRKNVTLVQRYPKPDKDMAVFVEVKRWNFLDAFPVSWKIPSLSVDNTQKIVIETLELAFREIVLDPVK